MERFWNVFWSVTKLFKENIFLGNLVTKQQKYNTCTSDQARKRCSAKDWSGSIFVGLGISFKMI